MFNAQILSQLPGPTVCTDLDTPTGSNNAAGCQCGASGHAVACEG
jgi:hypothetical protein